MAHYDYWNKIGTENQNTDREYLWRNHLQWIWGRLLAHWATGNPQKLALKTDLFDEALSPDHLISLLEASFIEGNSPPGVMVWQVHAPLLQDERLKRFYREQGMIL